MNDLRQNLLPIAALLLTGITAFFAEAHMPYKLPFAVYRYPAAIAIIYAFFRFVMFADKRRTVQLDEVGLFKPLRDGAFLVCAHAHLLELGAGLNWLSPDVSMPAGALAWVIFLFGQYAPQQPQGVPARLTRAFSFSQTEAGHAFFCRGLRVSGLLGVAGTFTAAWPILWSIIPVLITAWFARRRFGTRA